MNFNKNEVRRAIKEFTEYSQNMLHSRFDSYTLRVTKLLNLIEKNNVLNKIIGPYFEYEFDSENIGLIQNEISHRVSYKIPEDEDLEIAILLQILKKNSKDDNLRKIAFSIYFKKSFQDNIDIFNQEIVLPPFQKLLRKLEYILEDLENDKEKNIDSNNVQIINIETIKSKNSMIAIGSNITQINKDNIFDKLEKEIEDKIDNKDDKNKLIDLLEKMKEEKDNKENFKITYDKFLLEIGKYMTIIGPFLPYFLDYLF